MQLCVSLLFEYIKVKVNFLLEIIIFCTNVEALVFLEKSCSFLIQISL